MKKIKELKKTKVVKKTKVNDRLDYNCSFCKGEGLVGAERCISCGGTGKI